MSKKTYRLLASLLLMLVATLTSCEKFSIDETTGKSREANANVTIHVQKIEGTSLLTTKAADKQMALSDVCSRLTLAIFDGEEKLETVNQLSTDNGFGTAYVSLDEGEYRLVVIAHNGKGNCSISAPEKVKFASNKLTDTFYYYGRLSVNEEDATTDINLRRAVGAFKLHITDETIPEEIRSIKFYYTGGSSTLDATTGFGCVNSRQTENFSMEDGGRDFTVYTFPHEEEKNIKMSISFLDADAKVVKSFEKADLKIHQNHTAYTEISIADGFGGGDDSTGGGIGITVDPTWGETERVNF